MLFLKKILLIIFVLLCINSYGQVVRFNVTDKGIGIQTPPDWHIYSHAEIRLFSHPIVSDVKIGVITAQFAYMWLLAERGGIRSGLQITYWGFHPPQQDDNLYYFTELIPIGIILYPFAKDYMGFDLYSILNTYTMDLNIGATFLVRF